MSEYEKHWNYRVIHSATEISPHYFDTSAKAERFASQVAGRIECYVWGYGWTRWVPAMREPEAVQ